MSSVARKLVVAMCLDALRNEPDKFPALASVFAVSKPSIAIPSANLHKERVNFA